MLRAIIHLGDQIAAILDHRIVQPGDFVAGVAVVAIEEKRVLLRGELGERWFSLPHGGGERSQR